MGKSLRLLIVDDTADDAVLTLRHLRREGYETHSATVDELADLTGALDDAQWDAIICDYKMPNLDPFAVLDALRVRGLDTPLIVISGRVDEAVLVSLMKAGAQDIILKSNLSRLGPAIEREIKEAGDRASRRRAEQRLHEALAELSSHKMAMDAHAIVGITNTAGTIIYANDKFCRVSGYDRDELIGQDHRILNSGYHSRMFFVDMWRTIARGDPWHAEIRNRSKDGKYYWVDTTIAPYRDETGRIVQYISVRTDITRRKAAEAELRKHGDDLEALVVERTAELQESRDTCMAAINAIQDGFGLVDPEGRAVLANATLEQYFPEFKALVAKRAPLTEEIATLFPGRLPGAPKAAEIEAMTLDERQLPDGRWLSIKHSLTPAGGAIAICSDITRFKLQQETLEQQAIELHGALAKEMELSELQRQFISMASHELRTPLAIIDASTRRLIQRKHALTPEEVERRTDKIRRAVDRMTRLMESTLSAARMDNGGIALRPDHIDIRRLLGMVCEHQQDLSPNHMITSDLDGLPGTVVADGNALEQVFTNLLSNAVKYSPHAPHIRVEGWQRDGHAYVSVRDHGLGIDEDELPHMFKRFFRARTAAGIAGTGIGLDLSRKLVEAHGGTVSVESRARAGSAFTVKLPIDGIAACATLTGERAVGGSAR